MSAISTLIGYNQHPDLDFAVAASGLYAGATGALDLNPHTDYNLLVAAYDKLVEGEVPFSTRWIRECPNRTILMITAISRLVEQLLRTNNPDSLIKVVEAGSGSGVIALTTALMNKRVRVTCLEVDDAAIASIKLLCQKLDLNDRVSVRKFDLAKEVYSGDCDILIAEHIAPGGWHENAVLGRAVVNARPELSVPYSVTPMLIEGIRITTGFGLAIARNVLVDYDPAKVRFTVGDRIVLNDPSAPTGVDLEGEIITPTSKGSLGSPGIMQINTALDIDWTAPEFDPNQELRHCNRHYLLPDVPSGRGFNDFLLGPVVFDRRGGDYTLENYYSTDQASNVRVSYQFGAGLLTPEERLRRVTFQSDNLPIVRRPY